MSETKAALRRVIQEWGDGVTDEEADELIEALLPDMVAHVVQALADSILDKLSEEE